MKQMITIKVKIEISKLKIKTPSLTPILSETQQVFKKLYLLILEGMKMLFK
jgi:hypothetical protein